MRVTVSIPDPVGEEAEAAAHEESTSVSALYAEAMERYLEQRRRERAFKEIDALIGNVSMDPEILDQLDRDRDASDRGRPG